jgi:hypothetical protein
MKHDQEIARHTSFCGSYCHTCDWFTGRIKRAFRTALHTLDEYAFGGLLESKVN